MQYTIKQLSTLAGVSVRTLHYYDEIGLLTPGTIRANGYREYGDESVMRLQQILFYRELDLSLKEIKAILTRPDFNAVKALEAHRLSLEGRARRIERLIKTLTETLAYMKGKKSMSNKQLFAAFSDEEQEKYAAEAERMYDPEIVRKSQAKWKSYTPEDRQRIADEGNMAYAAMVAAIPQGASSPEAQAGVELWRKHMDYFWTPNLDQLVGLAELYNTDPRFKANFDKIDGRLAAFMQEAVAIYVKRKK
jgi:DNA-binding transcriptional MerR regulator